MPDLPALTAEALEERLEEHVDAVLSSRRTAAAPARDLARFSRSQQDFVLHWVAAIARTNSEMAYQFAAHAAQALEQMDEDGVQAWLLSAMDHFDRQGLTAGIAMLKAVKPYAQARSARITSLALEEVSRVLENFIQGLSGRRLRIEAGEATYTDTETLFLPGLINRFSTREDNFRLYKATAVHLWAQTWYGTWRVELAAPDETLAHKARAIQLFHAFETLRLNACIRRDLPGVYRDLCALKAGLDAPVDERFAALASVLSTPDARALGCPRPRQLALGAGA